MIKRYDWVTETSYTIEEIADRCTLIHEGEQTHIRFAFVGHRLSRILFFSADQT